MNHLARRRKLELIDMDGTLIDEVILIACSQNKTEAKGSHFISDGYYLTNIDSMEKLARLKAKKRYNGLLYELRKTNYRE